MGIGKVLESTNAQLVQVGMHQQHVMAEGFT
jgi:hypothetical protein